MKRLFIRVLLGVWFAFMVVQMPLVPVSALLPPMVQISAGTGDDGGGITTPDYVKNAHGDENWSTTNTVPFTPAAGTNRCFIAFPSWLQNRGITGVTFDGTPMTQRDTANATGMDMAAYTYCTDSGTSEVDVVATIDGSANQSMVVIQVDGCNTSDPVETTDDDVSSNEADTIVEMSVDTTGQTNTLLVSSAAVNEEDSNVMSVCNGTGQTLLGDEVEPGEITQNSSHYDHDTAGVKAQCFDTDGDFDEGVGITLAIKPNGS